MAIRILAPGLFLLAVVAGCTAPPPPPEGTGAEEVAQEFYLAMLHEDWTRAYTALDPASRQHLSQPEFSRKARSQRLAVGFEPKEFHVRSCEEHADEAIAHVVLTGETATERRVYKDDVVLHRSVAGWGVVLPAQFGRPQAKRR
jgi:hypothetical protein